MNLRYMPTFVVESGKSGGTCAGEPNNSPELDTTRTDA